jgi:N-acetylglutamate synthase
MALKSERETKARGRIGMPGVAVFRSLWRFDAMTSSSPSPLASRMERACLKGWPALEEIALDGWLLGLSEGYTRRSNSVQPYPGGAQDLREKIAHCEQIYDGRKLPTIFRILSTTEPDLSHALDERGYLPPEDETLVLHMKLEAYGNSAASKIELTERMPSDLWLDTLGRLQGHHDRILAIHRRILEKLSGPAAFVSVKSEDDRLAALAFGAVHEGVVCVNSVVTDPELRRRGYARKAVSAVLEWAIDAAGAAEACIPVVGSNAPAIALYQGLGFRQEAYRYHYRRRAAS